MKKKILPVALLASALLTSACGSTYTVIDRSEIHASSNSTTVAHTLLPGNERNPALIEHLALAEELYQQKLRLLNERRNKARARKRDLNFASFGLMGAAGLGVGALAIGSAASSGDNGQALVTAGTVSLVGLGIGTILQLTAAMQEEPTVADDKIRTLQRSYETMLERVRTINQRAQEVPAEALHSQNQLAGIIETFINETLQVNVKG